MSDGAVTLAPWRHLKDEHMCALTGASPRQHNLMAGKADRPQCWANIAAKKQYQPPRGGASVEHIGADGLRSQAFMRKSCFTSSAAIDPLRHLKLWCSSAPINTKHYNKHTTAMIVSWRLQSQQSTSPLLQRIGTAHNLNTLTTKNGTTRNTRARDTANDPLPAG